MNKYVARWENAKKKCAKIQKLLAEGYLIFDADGNKIRTAEIKDDHTFYINSGFYFLNDMNLDNGMYTPIKEFNKTFSDWVYVHPKNVKKGI